MKQTKKNFFPKDLKPSFHFGTPQLFSEVKLDFSLW